MVEDNKLHKLAIGILKKNNELTNDINKLIELLHRKPKDEHVPTTKQTDKKPPKPAKKRKSETPPTGFSKRAKKDSQNDPCAHNIKKYMDTHLFTTTDDISMQLNIDKPLVIKSMNNLIDEGVVGHISHQYDETASVMYYLNNTHGGG